LAAVLSASVPALSAPAGASEPINGGGSTWSAVAIQQWQGDVAREGLTVNYQATGSTAGRQGYTAGTYDFAVSEIPFQPKYCTNPSDPNTCYDELTQPGLLARPYLYMPIVAGGTSLLYNLTIQGQRFTHLRLDPVTLTKIFTGGITNWDNPAIAADNPGVQFPNLQIQPVVRSDGAGTSYQFTAFLAYEDAGDWSAFCRRAGIAQSPCPPTSQFPYSALPNSQAVDGSDGVANWVGAPYNNGSIGYAEAAYGYTNGIPLASLRNAAGVYAQPTPQAVAVALTRAIINADHTQNLYGVYANPDPRTYPMSSYSYMVVPITDSAPMDLSKGQTLSRFILYFLCQGQQEAAPLYYSPLPPNLVEIGFSVEQRIPGAAPPPPLRACNDPTITDGFLNGIGTPTVRGQGGGPTSGAVGPAGTTPASGPATTAASGAAGAGRNNADAVAVRSSASSGSRGARASARSSHSSTTDTTASPELAVSSPQLYGRPFRPTAVEVSVLVVVVLVALILGPPAVALRRRRSR
jgi:phosphate transport system substrate-binding protein